MKKDEKRVNVGNVCSGVPAAVDMELQATEGQVIRAQEPLELTEQE